MPYDAEAYDDSPTCPACGLPILTADRRTLMHRHGAEPQTWHAECAQPHWDRLTPLLTRLQRGFST